MRLYLRLAWRNLWRHRRRTLIVALAIGLTMAMMMMYDGLIAGFDTAIYANAIKVLGGNVQIHAIGYQDQADQTPLLPLADDQTIVKDVLAQPNVVSASRRIKTGGLISNHEGAFPVGIVGIEPEQEQTVSLEAQHVVAGHYLTAADKDVIFIGKGLANAMDVNVGDRVTLAGKATHDQMRTRTMTIGGVFDLGMTDIEKRTIYMSLGEAQNLYNLTGQSTEVAVSLQQLGQEAALMSALKPALTGYEMGSWQTNFPELQQALDAKGGVMNIFSVIILMIAGIGILNLLLMAIYERTREIGLLGAIGMKPRQISLLFLLEGIMMGLVGVALGVVLGLAFNGLLRVVGLDFGSYSSVTQYMALITGKVYPTFGVDKLAQRIPTALIICLFASYYPARVAASREPAEALHFV